MNTDYCLKMMKQFVVDLNWDVVRDRDGLGKGGLRYWVWDWKD